MPNVAAVLKEEMARVARKEIRAQTDVVRRSSAQYRRDIASLKRELGDAQRRIASLEKEIKRSRETTRPASASEGALEGRRFSAKGLKSHRERIGFSAADYGVLLGVTGQSVYNWENGTSRPRAAQLAAIIELRGLGKREAIRRLEGAEE